MTTSLKSCYSKATCRISNTGDTGTSRLIVGPCRVFERPLAWLAKRRDLRIRCCKRSSNRRAFGLLACASILGDMVVFG